MQTKNRSALQGIKLISKATPSIKTKPCKNLLIAKSFRLQICLIKTVKVKLKISFSKSEFSCFGQKGFGAADRQTKIATNV